MAGRGGSGSAGVMGESAAMDCNIALELLWLFSYPAESHSSRLIFALLNISARRLAPISSPW
jgi:hypothetical protein